MKSMRKSLFGNVVIVCLMAMFLMAANDSHVLAKTETGIQVRHKAIVFFVPEKRIRLEARIIKDDSEIKLVRCYFRATGQTDYVFVGMELTQEGAYTAILPAPSKETTTLQYLFLVADQSNQLIKTQVYTMSKKESKTVPSWQQVSSEGTIQVSTEVGEAQTSVPGFSDSITMDVAESSVRFGIVAGGIYTVEGAAAGTGIAAGGATVSTATEVGTTVATGAAAAGSGTTAVGTAGAVTGGTVATSGAAATAAGIGLSSTGTIVGIGVGAAALVGGVAAAANSGGNDIPPSDTISIWEFHSRCANSSVESPVVFNIQLNETKGGIFDNSGSGQRADYEGGLPITMSIDGSYDAKNRVISGGITTITTNLPFSCQRIDNFSFAIPSGSNDTGYQNVVEQGSTCGTESGCTMQVRFFKK